MNQHPALAPGRAAVITGAASGIGLAMAERCLSLGMKVCLADIDDAALKHAAENLRRKARRSGDVLDLPTDVSRREQVERLRDHAYEAFGDVALVMNNAGREGGGGLLGSSERWEAILGTNLWGVVHGVQAFAPKMMEQRTPSAIVNTGSKQGITTPPGDTAYNVSKAGVKVVTEALAHELRNRDGCLTTTHLLVPGFTFTGFIRVRTSERPAGAWTPEEVIDFLLPAMARGDFYVLCPDNDVTRDVDEKRIRWAAEDIVQNRPALSRWHPDYKDEFATYMQG